MAVEPRTRLHELCSCALEETDPQELASLLIEIEDILCETMAELSTMLKDVENVLNTHVNPRGNA